MKNPFILIGMHRSGTSMLAKVLDEAGIFMGVVKDHNYEAIHFLSINQRSLWASDANWLEPRVPYKDEWKLIPKKELYQEHFKLTTRMQKLKYAFFAKAWGWKDPRNTFTLPMWLSLFPKAKVIYLKRNPDAIVKSLHSRNTMVGEVYDKRLEDLHFCRELTEKYQTKAASYAQQLGSRFIEVSYEELVAHNALEIKRLEKFTRKKLAALFKAYAR